MGRLQRKPRTQQLPSSIISLPYDLLAEIAARVASSSLKDLSSIKLSCKVLSKAGLDNQVFRRATLKSMGVVNWRPFSKISSFLKRCEETENPDSLFKLGVLKYFSYDQVELGHRLLQKAINMGHLEATYTMGLILYREDSSNHKGIELLKRIERSKLAKMGINKCRKRLKKILREIWINKVLRPRESTCVNPTCKNGRIRRGWSERCHEDCFCCEACKWGFEYNCFCNMLIGAPVGF